jgi:hypothetical protein
MAAYTKAQAQAMADATTIDPIDEVATVRNDHRAESDPAFFMDYQWLAWFFATHGDKWGVDDEMHDSWERGIVWTIPLYRRR